MPSNSSPAHFALRTVEQIINTITGWYTTPSNDRNTITLHPYTGHHPKNHPATHYIVGNTREYDATYNSDTDHIEIGRYTTVEDIPLESPTLENTLEDYLTTELADITRKEMHHFGSSLTQSIRNTLRTNFDSAYDVLTTSDEELREIRGVGDKRLAAIKEYRYSSQNHPNWAFYTICPDCGEEFWSAYQANKNCSNPPQIDDIHPQTYCPVCNTNDIPKAYIDAAEPFTDKTINTYSTGTAVAKNNTSLSDF